MLAGLLATVLSAGILSSSGHAQTDAAQAECDRLINVLEQRPPAEAFDALQQMQVYRQGNQYQACIETAQAMQNGAGSQGGLQAERITGMDVLNENGVQIGEVDGLVRGNDQRTYAFVTYRGPRWPGNKQVALPVENMTLQSGNLIVFGIGEDELRNMPSVNQDGRTYTVLSGSEMVNIQRSGGSPTETGTVESQQ